MTKLPALLRIGPRRQVPSDGSVDPYDFESVCRVEMPLMAITLLASDGALGARCCLPLLACDTCDASDTLDALRLKFVPTLNGNDVERPEEP